MDSSQPLIKRRRVDMQETVDEARMNEATLPGSDSELTEALRKAAMVKEGQGFHETEVSFGGEAALHQTFILCQKNPNHRHFIPIYKFNMKDLPSAYRDELVLELIRDRAALTCRLSGNYISENRPRLYPESDEHFPFYNERGRSDMTRVGTGWVNWIRRNESEFDDMCECMECASLYPYKRKEVWGLVQITTVAHVVCDNTEAEKTTCHFFYDDGEMDVNTVPKLHGGRVVKCDIKGDFCVMEFITHDVHLLNRLDEMFWRCYELDDKVFEKVHNRDPATVDESRDSYLLNSLAVCVSHPHSRWRLKREERIRRCLLSVPSTRTTPRHV